MSEASFLSLFVCLCVCVLYYKSAFKENNQQQKNNENAYQDVHVMSMELEAP
jgi:hypothetical protein